MTNEMVVKIPFVGRDELSDVVRGMRSNVRSFGDSSRSVFRNLRKDVLSVKSVMGGILGARVITGGLDILRNQVTSVTDEVIEFDHAVTKAAARHNLDKTTEGFRELSKAARETGAITRFTATDSAKALDSFAMSGISLKESLDLVKPTAKLAMAADLELADSAMIASTALAVFDRKVSDFTDVSDVLAFTANSTKTNLAEMFETIQKGGGAIREAGGDVETFSAIARAMGDYKIVGEKAATSMKTGFLRLTVGGKTADKELKKLNLTIKDQDGNIRDLFTILGDLEKKYAKMTQQERLRSMRKLFGLESLPGMLAVMKTGATTLEKYREEARRSTGYVDQLSEKMGMSYENKIKEIQSAVVETGFKIIEEFGDEIPGALDYAIKTIRNLDTTGIRQWMREALELGKSAVEVIKSSIPYLKTAAILWAGFKVTAGLNAAVGTFNHLRESVYLFNRGINPLRTNLSDVQKGLNRIDGKRIDGLGKSVDMSKIKVLGLIDTIALLAGAGFVGWEIGSRIRENIIDPFIEGAQRLEVLKQGLHDFLNQDLAKVSENVLLANKKEAKEAIKLQQEQETGLGFVMSMTGMGGAGAMGAGFGMAPMPTKQMDERTADRKKITDELERRRFMDDVEKSGYTMKSIMDDVGGQSIDLNNKIQVESVIRFEGNTPEGVTGESNVTAPTIDRRNLGSN